MLKLRKLGLFNGGGGGGGIGGSGTLSAPLMGFPTPQQAYTTPAAVSISVKIGVDWISGNTFKLYKSVSPSMSSPTLVGSHTVTDADITAGSFTVGIGTLSAITYLCSIGNDGTNDSQYLSNVVAWGSVTAPAITTSGTQTITEQTPLWVSLTATGTGGIPPQIISSTVPSGWAIVGGADQLQYQEAVVSNVVGLEWVNNGVESYSAPANSTGNAANPYYVTVQATDLFGNNSAPLSIATTVTQISQTPSNSQPWFTNVSGAPISTLETSNTITWTGLTPGFNIPLQLTFSSGVFQYNNNGGGWVNATSGATIYVQNGWTFQLRVTSPGSSSSNYNTSLTIGNPTNTTQSWTVATAGSSATNTIGAGGTGAGTNKSKFINATAFQVIVNNNVGQPLLDRSDVSQANVGWYVEGTINGFVSGGGQIIFGVDDGSVDLNGGGVGDLGSGQYPGRNIYTGNGFSLAFSVGGTTIGFYANGGINSTSITLPGGNVSAVGDTMGIYYNSTSKVVTIYYYSVVGGDLGQIYTTTLTANIPANVYIVQGGQKGNGTASTSDSITTNYGATSYVRTAPSGSTYFA